MLSDEQLVRRYVELRDMVGEAKRALERLHDDLMGRVEAAGGVLQTRGAYAIIDYQRRREIDRQQLEALLAAGMLRCTYRAYPRLLVVKRRA